MSKKPKPELTDSDNPEWTAQDIRTSVPFSGLPATLQAKLRGRGPQKAPPKISGLSHQNNFGIDFKSNSAR